MEVGEQIGSGEYLEEGAEVEAPPQSAAQAQTDLSGLSADDMKSYSESVAQAADVVNNESEADAKTNLDTMSLADLKKASIASAKAEKQLAAKTPKTSKASIPKPAVPKEDQQLLDQEQKGLDMKNPDLEAKAALVAQAEAANQAAIEDSTPPLPGGKMAQAQRSAKEASLEELDADQKKEQQKQQENAKFNQDKQAALDQGYSEEQAELFAKQEAYAASMSKPMQPQTTLAAQTAPVAAAPAPPRSNTNAAKAAEVAEAIPAISVPVSSAPSSGQPAAAYEVAQPEASLAVPEDIPIEQQIKQAQEQQALIKAQLEKKK